MKSDCRFLFLTPQLAAGGLERQLYNLMLGMDRQVHQAEVVVWNHDDDAVFVRRLRDAGLSVISLPRGSRIEKLRCLCKVVNALQPEVVHSYGYYTNVAAWLACVGTGSVPVGSVRNDYLDDRARAGWWLGRLSSRWPRHQICNSSAASKNASLATGPFAPGVVHVVHNAVDLAAYDPTVGPQESPLIILGIGSLTRKKRWDRLLTIVSRWLGANLNVVVKIAGEGPLRRELESQMSRLRLGDRVELLGEVEDVAGWLGRASIVVHVAQQEGRPNVVLEAMAAGRPVVATDVGDVAAVVQDGLTGYVVAQDDLVALDERVRVLIESPERRLEMGRAARTVAEREFGSEVDATLAAYEQAGWRG